MPGRLNEIHSRIAQLISIATVIEVDCQKAKARVEFNKIKSSWLPWLCSFAGNASSWAPLEVGEQVVLLCPSGNLNQAVILRGLYHQQAAPPSKSEDEHIVSFADGSSVSHNSKNSTLTINTAGTVLIKSANEVNIQSSNINLNAGSVSINAGNIKFSGNMDVDGNIKCSGNIDVDAIITAKKFQQKK